VTGHRQANREAARGVRVGTAPLRILLATDHYPPYIGGAQRQNHLIAHELARRGYEVAVATVWQHSLPDNADEDGVQVHRLRQLRTLMSRGGRGKRHHQPPFADPVTVLQLRRLINSFEPDLVHACGWFSYSCALALVGKKVPLIVSARDYGYGCAKRTLLREGTLCDGPAVLKCARCAGRYYGVPKGWAAMAGVLSGRNIVERKLGGIHSVSTYVRDMVRRDFIDDTAILRRDVPHAVIPDIWVDDEPAESEASQTRQRLAELPSGEFILFVGAFRLVKGITQLIEAHARLESPPPLVLIGTVERDTPEFPADVHVLTDFPHAAVMEAYKRCLFAVLPSVWAEPCGTVIEGMISGKAVIGTYPGGHSDLIVDGETGLLVGQGDVNALAHAMQRLLDDRSMRERMGAAARRRAELVTLRAAFPQLEELYARVARST
jgi:glycosyltransferase involved in cell wall biosynthesis